MCGGAKRNAVATLKCGLAKCDAIAALKCDAIALLRCDGVKCDVAVIVAMSILL